MVLYDCLIKTQHFAKKNILSIECEFCQISAGYSIFTGPEASIFKETPINGGLTYKGPKVAEYPGR